MTPRRFGSRRGPQSTGRGDAVKATLGRHARKNADPGGQPRSAERLTEAYERAPERYIYGLHPIIELLRAAPERIERILVVEPESARLSAVRDLAREHGVPFEHIGRRGLTDLVGEVTHQGIAARVQPFTYVELDEILHIAAAPALIVVLDHIQDPHNFGALVRSAYALGAHGLVFPKDRACEVTAAVVKAAAGATAHLPMARVTNLRRALDRMKLAGLWTVGLVPDAPQTMSEIDLRQPIALVIGSESDGLRKMTAENCDFLASIAMTGALGSLNAAVAGAIGLYEAARQRRECS